MKSHLCTTTTPGRAPRCLGAVARLALAVALVATLLPGAFAGQAPTVQVTVGKVKYNVTLLTVSPNAGAINGTLAVNSV